MSSIDFDSERLIQVVKELEDLSSQKRQLNKQISLRKEYLRNNNISINIVNQIMKARKDNPAMCRTADEFIDFYNSIITSDNNLILEEQENDF